MAKLLFNKYRPVLMVSLALTVSSAVVSAQGYYDDDIYYDASRKTETKKQQKQQQQTVSAAASTRSSYYVVNNGSVSTADYPSADTYVLPEQSLDMDVDAYNRRGQFLVSDDVQGDSTTVGDFAYTQRIERFHNPDIVAGSDDQELQDVYAYAMQQPQNVNIYVISDPWDYYYGPSWTWSWRYRHPWYWNAWGPFYAGWGWDPWYWDPYCSWGYGCGWGFGWGHCWSPGWGHGWNHGWGPSYAWRPVTPSGSSRPHNQVGGGGSMAAHRPGSYSPASVGVSRPGNMGRGRFGTSGAGTVNSASSTRPGYSPSAAQQAGNGSTVSGQGGNMNRGRSAMNSSNGSSNTRSSSNYNTRSSSSRSSSGYRSSGSGSRGASGTHGSSGASRSGGGSRGRR